MTTDLDTVGPKTDIAEAAEHMARLQHPAPARSCDDGELVGIISIRDLTNWAVARAHRRATSCPTSSGATRRCRRPREINQRGS